MTASQILRRLLSNGRAVLAVLIAFNVLMAVVAVALLPAGFQVLLAAPTIIVDVSLINFWKARTPGS